MSRIMLTANEARAKSLQDIIILREIRDIEEAILEACDLSQVQVELEVTTTMAKVASSPGYMTAIEYYDTWTSARDDRQKYLQMESVIKYFTDLGYAIERRVNIATGTTFKWVVAW